MLQDWKSEKYQQLIGSGEVPARPGVLRLMDEARDAGLLVAVCSAASKESVIFTLTSLLGPQRFSMLDCFMAGDDVPRKKPDPIIYQIAAGAPLRSRVVCVLARVHMQTVLGLRMAIADPASH